MSKRPSLEGGELREPESGGVVNPLEAQTRLRASLRSIPWSALRPHPRQPKERHAPENVADLRESIRAFGILQPPLVRRLPDGSFQILFGHRRATAAQLLVLERVLEAKGRVWVVEDVTDFEALCVITAEYYHQQDVKSEVAKAEWLGGVADECERALGRPVGVREMAHLVPPQKTTINDSLKIYRALQDPDIGPLVRGADKAGKELLCKALDLADFRAQTEALCAFANGGKSAMRSVIELHRSQLRGRPASVVKRRKRRNGAYEVVITVPGSISPSDTDAILRELDAVRADVLARSSTGDSEGGVGDSLAGGVAPSSK